MLKYVILFTLIPVFAFAECGGYPPEDNVEADSSTSKAIELSNHVNAVTNKIAKKVVDIEVSWDGSGSIHVLVDEHGNFAGMKLTYKGSLMGMLEIDKLNKGETIKFHDPKVKPDPLELGVKQGTKLDAKNGGTFNLKAYIAADKPFFQNYEVQLKKVNGVWKAYRGSNIVTKTVLDPKVSWGSWTGSFKSVKFL